MNKNRTRTRNIRENTEHERTRTRIFSKVSNTNEHEHIFSVKYWTRTNTNTHFFENVEHERTRTRVSLKLLNTANTNEHEHACSFIPGHMSCTRLYFLNWKIHIFKIATCELLIASFICQRKYLDKEKLRFAPRVLWSHFWWSNERALILLHRVRSLY